MRKAVFLYGFIVIVLSLSACNQNGSDSSSARDLIKKSDNTLPVPQIDFNPEQYVCYQTGQPLNIDGKLDENVWAKALWTNEFVDIEGGLKPVPYLKTRVKMLWDDNYFYCAAEMEEPHVWAKLKKRDAVIYHDNDFEVFIDPDGDTHEYYELEVNALNTQWDLFLGKPYRDGGPAINAWDIQGLKTAISINGTLNNPKDVDRGWLIEIAIPWEVLKQCAHKDAPPSDGDQWRVNFSRVQWQTEIKNGKYIKTKDSLSGDNLPENNWVWSPQGLIAMHYPEMWGIVQFSASIAGSGVAVFSFDVDEEAKWELRKLYYAQRTFNMQYGFFAENIEELNLKNPDLPDYQWPPVIKTTASFFEARISRTDETGFLCISHDGDIWFENITQTRK